MTFSWEDGIRDARAFADQEQDQADAVAAAVDEHQQAAEDATAHANALAEQAQKASDPNISLHLAYASTEAQQEAENARQAAQAEQDQAAYLQQQATSSRIAAETQQDAAAAYQSARAGQNYQQLKAQEQAIVDQVHADSGSSAAGQAQAAAYDQLQADLNPGGPAWAGNLDQVQADLDRIQQLEGTPAPPTPTPAPWDPDYQPTPPTFAGHTADQPHPASAPDGTADPWPDAHLPHHAHHID